MSENGKQNGKAAGLEPPHVADFLRHEESHCILPKLMCYAETISVPTSFSQAWPQFTATCNKRGIDLGNLKAQPGKLEKTYWLWGAGHHLYECTKLTALEDGLGTTAALVRKAYEDAHGHVEPDIGAFCIDSQAAIDRQEEVFNAWRMLDGVIQTKWPKAFAYKGKVEKVCGKWFHIENDTPKQVDSTISLMKDQIVECCAVINALPKEDATTGLSKWETKR